MEKRDYNMGLLRGIKLTFKIGKSFSQNETIEEMKKMTPDQLEKFKHGASSIFIENILQYHGSDAYKLGLKRGIGFGSDFLTKFSMLGISPKSK
jgi:hypothetical protein